MARKPVAADDWSTAEVLNRTVLGDHVKMAEALEAALDVLNQKTSNRVTGRQLLAFAAIAVANSVGKRITVTDVCDRYGEAEDGSDIGANLAKSYLMFLQPSRKDPSALGWVDQQPDSSDGRRKYLVLSEVGRMAALDLFQAMGGGE